ncbi:Lrp/AsnC family transcriptional regulator [Roseibium sp. CAU 1637]|uniref:Lrp/AsnC family transcriptional regulator n=1 Tax=Roseibium limicola TaxID=2816037 RepID=A0A939EL60_9HYPH|nr:Lrp/AsnC family transcriptional regulator [Roseibium limicola]MBO0344457.1 Lrp/AsnC family transcriptional regulator [Roseibium limicola]
MDRIDRTILNLLQTDASRTNADLAGELGLAPSSCMRRIRRLKASGMIERIVAILNPAKVNRGIKAMVMVELERHGETWMRRFLEPLKDEPSVVQAYSVSGSTDVVMMLRLKDIEEFDTLSDRLFRDDANVARYTTLFVIRTAKETTFVPV